MKALLTDIIKNSRWTYPAFEGKIIIEGRILSPVESQTVGLGAALIASGVTNKQELSVFNSVKNEKDINEDNADDIFKALKNFDIDKIMKLSENQDKILCKCITRASIDGGGQWNNFSVVMSEKQQSAKQNRLWVGMLNDEDRKNMIDLCMEGHKKARETIRGQL